VGVTHAKRDVLGVETTHNKPNDCLRKQTSDHGPLRAKVINHERTNEGTRHVEQIDHDIPSENDVERIRPAGDGVDNCGRIYTERISELDGLKLSG
jgi:hypothetical protein